MACNLTLTFPSLNYSLQIGDTAYYTNYSASGGFAVGNANLIELGPIQAIEDLDGDGVLDSICILMTNGITPPTTDSFIFFSKDNKVNLSSVVGYYGEMLFKNSSKKKAELFAVACEVSESSK
tara:strand:+ start:147 stop:515 length:369 start_codon:yes stop_codon:yes gene_type:complete